MLELRTNELICRLAATCPKAGQCGHGRPHILDSHCIDADICYDHDPPERAWCELTEVTKCD